MSDPTGGPEPNPASVRVLVVDDNEPGRRALAKFLELQGYAVAEAADGTSALEALRVGPPPRVVLTDLMLPDVDGREVARHARRLAPPPFVILITGWDAEESREEVGPDVGAVFLKPVALSELLAKIRGVTGVGPPS